MKRNQIAELITDPRLKAAWEKYAGDNLNADLAAEGLQAVMINPGYLVAYADNPNIHDQESIAAIMRSVQAHGFKNVVLVMPNAVIIYGHGRVTSAIDSGKALIPVFIAIDLTVAQAASLRIADNATAHYSHFDSSILSSELKKLDEEGFDLAATALRGDEIALALSENPLSDVNLDDGPDGGPADNSAPSGESSEAAGMEENWVVYLIFPTQGEAQAWLTAQQPGKSFKPRSRTLRINMSQKEATERIAE